MFKAKTTTYADEGSAAHALGEAILSGDVAKQATARMSAYWNEDMEAYVGDYVEFVRERLSAAQAATPDAKLNLEQRLDYSEWVPDGFGTGDVVIIADDLLEVIDLKYGKGIPVDASDNPQLRLYGLGALRAFDMLYDIKRIRMTIVQPRLDSITIDELTTDELVKWAETYVKPRAELAFAGKGDYCSGDHCRFCKGAAKCRALAEKCIRHDFTPANMLNEDEIAVILTQVDQLAGWAASVKEYALEQATNHGVRFPGWKLVEGRSNRRYVDQDKVAQTLIKSGINEAIIYERSLLGITAMEKAISKKRFNELIGDLVVKPSGKPVLVPESDRRAEHGSTQSARLDFAD
jgi:hypothetical protein